MTEPVRLRLDRARRTGPQQRFWRSTGFTPAELLLLPEMRQTLDHLAALPDRGIEFLRVHYLLDLVRGEATARGHRYDWALLDAALDSMVERGLRPFFELMGNPSSLFDGFAGRDALLRWRDLTAELAARCIGRYGRDEVRAWYFESWNEPDLPWWRWGTQGFLDYYDACVEGLGAVDPALRIGGPGTARPLSDMFKAFVAHCDSGANALTGARGVRLDFISVHEKGAIKHEEDLTPDTLGIIAREMQAVRWLREHHPRLAALPFVNNECDPQVGWIIPHTWHALPYFGALIAKVVDQHQRLMMDAEGVEYGLLSNDNGFIGRWGHRTMLTCFGDREVRAAQSEHRTDLAAVEAARDAPVRFSLVKKPGLTVMEFLSLLGPERLEATATPALRPDSDGLGVMATARGEGVVALIYNSVDRIWTSGVTPVEVSLHGLAPGPHDVTLLTLDEAHGIAFWQWEAAGAPARPDAAQLAVMRAAQDIGCLFTRRIEVAAAPVPIRFDVRLPSTMLLVVEPAGGEGGQPRELRATRYPGLDGEGEIMLTWQADPANRVTAFDVLHTATPAGPFRPLAERLLSRCFVHAAGAGAYRIRARTLGGELLGESDVLMV